ncbi:MAG TPA: 16S rRNA (cytidine(1402)-2'-O)-methyltransferase [Pseudohaliea sp.]|nr:16S rRNA (cytidine(1402)-2'-O)-methyltransferase [Pseudohaliea sp.]
MEALDHLLPPEPLTPGLYVAATPIGNLEDITLRALRVLRDCDAIACEDTRLTRRLVQRYDLCRVLLPYHEHNARAALPGLLRRLKEGQKLALVSDAGTPLVSDPGYRLVEAALAGGHVVTPLPGPSALLAGLVGAGLPTDRFFFAGFLPPKQAARRTALKDLAAVPSTLVFYEAPGRAAETLADMAALLGNRPACLARELTKKFEEWRRAPLSELAENAAAEPPRGECVLVVGPPPSDEATEADLDAILGAALERDSVRDAAAAVAEATGLPRRKVYARALELVKQGAGK